MIDAKPIPQKEGAAVTFFPRLTVPGSAGQQVKQLVTLSWLMMGEGFPIIEDIEGADQDPELLRSLRLVFANFLALLDDTLVDNGDMTDDHRLALAAEHGLTRLTHIDGAGFVGLTRLTHREEGMAEISYLCELWQRLLADYPVALVDPLKPENQGKVLRLLRHWTKACDAAGVESGFLAEMMKEV